MRWRWFWVVLVLFGGALQGQEFAEDKTLYDIKQEQEPILERQQRQLDADQGEGSDYNRYMRWLRTWEPRLAPHGDYGAVLKAEEAFYGRASDLPGSQVLNKTFNIASPWLELGPTRRPPLGLQTNASGATGVGPINFLVFDPQNPALRMLAGSYVGGLFYSEDGGASWHNAGTDTGWTRSGVAWALYDPEDSETWYAASEGHLSIRGVYRTDNEGLDWTLIADRQDLGGVWDRIYTFVKPRESEVLLVAARSGLYRTTQASAANPVWNRVLGGTLQDMELHPEADDVVYASRCTTEVRDDRCVNGGTWEVVVSQDRGATWATLPNWSTVPVTGIENLVLEVSPAAPNDLFVLVRSPGKGAWWAGGVRDDELFVYRGGSNAWERRSGSNDAMFNRGNAMTVSPFDADEIFLGSRIKMTKSLDGGQTWTGEAWTGPIQYHDDVEDIVFAPHDRDEVWTATHGGVYRSTDGGRTWINRSDGLGVAMTLELATSPTSPECIAIGLYHAGTKLSDGSVGPGWEPEWATVRGGDGLMPLFDPEEPKTLYASSQSSMRRSENRGASFPRNVSHNPPSWVIMAVLNPADSKILYTNTTVPAGNLERQEVVRSFDRGDNFERISEFQVTPGFTKYGVFRIYTAPSDPETLYVHVYDQETSPPRHRLLRTRKANAPAAEVIASWEELEVPHLDKWITDLEVDRENPEIVHLAYSSYSVTGGSGQGDGMLYRIDYSGQSPVTIDRTANLPAMGVGALEIERGSNEGIYLAGDFGVFYTNRSLLQDPSTAWREFGEALPHVRASGLEINYRTNRLRVGLNGRGVWANDLWCPEAGSRELDGVHTTDRFEEVREHLRSTAVVAKTAEVVYRAGKSITLGPGFEVENGAEFHAFIHPCVGSGNSFD